MRHRVVVALILALLFSPSAGVAAQDGADADLGFPDDIAVKQLAAADAPELPTAPAVLRLESVALPPEAGMAARETMGPELLVVESGALAVTDSLGLTSTLKQGASVLLRPGATYRARNDGRTETSVLRLSLAPTTGEREAAATPVASPVAAASPVETAVVTPLVEAEVAGLPAAPVRLFLSRATWKAGADSGPYTQSGPVAMLVESGTLTITSPSGIDGQLDAGNAVVLPADAQLRARNEGDDAAVVLIAGVIPAGGAAVQPVPPTPTPTATPSPTSEPSSTPTPTSTPLPSATPTPEPTTVPALYRITAVEGFASWGGSGDWKTVNGMLVNDGTNETTSAYIAAPYQPSTANYAIEAEIQFVRGESHFIFGIVARASDKGAYWAGWNGEHDAAVIAAGNYAYDDTVLANVAYEPDSEWHTYRLEVRGNSLRLLIDGSVVLDTLDNSFLDPGSVGLWSYRAQINVRSFAVIAL